METISISVPAMYADHHVIEVRQLISKLPGVEDMYASSAFKVVEVIFDEGAITKSEIESVLSEAGYLDELTLPIEAGAAAYLAEDTPSYFRHTEVYETTQDEISFAQNVSYTGRPLWNCPGIGVVKNHNIAGVRNYSAVPVGRRGPSAIAGAAVISPGGGIGTFVSADIPIAICLAAIRIDIIGERQVSCTE